jgi:hypothetical protein
LTGDQVDQELELHGSSAGGSFTGCRDCQSAYMCAQEGSVDVNKDGAMLTFMISWRVERLGKTVLGVVKLNDREVCARILKAGTQLTLGPDMRF